MRALLILGFALQSSVQASVFEPCKRTGQALAAAEPFAMAELVRVTTSSTSENYHHVHYRGQLQAHGPFPAGSLDKVDFASLKPGKDRFTVPGTNQKMIYESLDILRGQYHIMVSEPPVGRTPGKYYMVPLEAIPFSVKRLELEVVGNGQRHTLQVVVPAPLEKEVLRQLVGLPMALVKSVDQLVISPGPSIHDRFSRESVRGLIETQGERNVVTLYSPPGSAGEVKLDRETTVQMMAHALARRLGAKNMEPPASFARVWLGQGKPHFEETEKRFYESTGGLAKTWACAIDRFLRDEKFKIRYPELAAYLERELQHVSF